MFLKSHKTSLLEDLAKQFQIPIKDNLESQSQEGWVANIDSWSIEYREKDKSGTLVMYIYISAKIFINQQMEDWDQVLIDSLSYLEDAE